MNPKTLFMFFLLGTWAVTLAAVAGMILWSVMEVL